MDNTCRNIAVGLAALVVVSGCAGHSQRADAGSYRDDLSSAAASIDAAEKAGADGRRGADLNRARQKLAAARKASEDGDRGVAQRLAIEAGLDADVATAIARNEQMQSAATELQESIRTLQDELRRDEQRRLSRL